MSNKYGYNNDVDLQVKMFNAALVSVGETTESMHVDYREGSMMDKRKVICCALSYVGNMSTPAIGKLLKRRSDTVGRYRHQHTENYITNSSYAEMYNQCVGAIKAATGKSFVSIQPINISLFQKKINKFIYGKEAGHRISAPGNRRN